jgi:hypothetical protein
MASDAESSEAGRGLSRSIRWTRSADGLLQSILLRWSARKNRGQHWSRSLGSVTDALPGSSTRLCWLNLPRRHRELPPLQYVSLTSPSTPPRGRRPQFNYWHVQGNQFQ